LALTSSSCKKDDDTKPASSVGDVSTNNNFKIGGSISAEVNGVMKNYSEIEITSYGMAMNKGRLKTVDSSNSDTTYWLSVIVPLENGKIGTFDQKGFSGFEIKYEETVNSSNKNYEYKHDRKF